MLAAMQEYLDAWLKHSDVLPSTHGEYSACPCRLMLSKTLQVLLLSLHDLRAHLNQTDFSFAFRKPGYGLRRFVGIILGQCSSLFDPIASNDKFSRLY